MKDKLSSFRKIKFSKFTTLFSLGVFLGVRQLRRTSFWTNLLIVFVMTLTFLNLVAVSGILVGLVTGLSNEFRAHYSSDVLVSSLDNKSYIEQSQQVGRILRNTPGVENFVTRYVEPAQAEANYRTKTRASDLSDEVAVELAGIDPVAEDELTNLSEFVVEGEYLDPNDQDQVLVGKDLLERYAPESDLARLGTIANVYPGTKIRLNINGGWHEVTVKGIVFSKVSKLSLRVFFVDTQLRKLIGREDLNVDEIAIKVRPGFSPEQVVESLYANHIDKLALVQTWDEAQGTFFEDLEKTFNILGTGLGSIALAVAAITIFIVIYINAFARRKYIGILKAIGIDARAIELAYVVQSFFYAIAGSIVGVIIVYTVLRPFFAAHPIDFPFSNGILVAPFSETLLRLVLLIFVTLIAGYVPAKIVTKKNSLDAILGR